MHYLDLFVGATKGYWGYLWQMLTLQVQPWYKNYLIWLLAISAICLLLEWSMPWRKQQARFRRDFWLDFFYMFFNFYIFSALIYAGLSTVVVDAFNGFLMYAFGIENLVAGFVRSLPVWGILLLGFVVKDFVQWSTHVLLHRVPFLWEFHKVHHSVEEMGFAAHLRYHWMETIVYSMIQYLPLAFVGIDLADFFLIHLFTLLVGHLNHSNIYLPLGPLKYIFNNPQMHIWHHARDLPADRPNGINFGITLSVWDYLFGTARIPGDGRDIPLGFPGLEQFPKDFKGQVMHGFKR
jgi:sterol desaturase/sphingolipid hydroxylase (fatty acid hydroxylase superfamily)